MNPTIRIAILVLASTGLATGAAAQGSKPFSGLLPHASFPSDHAPDLTKKELVNGASNNWWFPFSYGKARQMVLYESHDLKIPNGRKITHLGFQAEAGQKSKGHKVLMRVFMGTSSDTAKSMKSTFAQNFDSPPVNVFGGAAGRIVDLPDLGDSLNPNKDRPFVWLTLDTPYTYDSSKNLVIDYHTLANDNSNNPFNYYTDVAQLLSPVAKLGDGCQDGSGKVPVLKSQPTSIGGNWLIDLSNAPSSSASIFIFSLGTAAVPVPFLRPDCKIHIDLSFPNFVPFQFLGTTNTSGRFRWSFPVPDSPALNDLHLYSQTVTADVFANAGITLSNSDDMQIGMHPRMSVVYRQGDPGTLTSGSVLRNWGVISHFRYN